MQEEIYLLLRFSFGEHTAKAVSETEQSGIELSMAARRAEGHTAKAVSEMERKRNRAEHGAAVGGAEN